ncbi:MAG TPA: hypothetical protein VH253_07875 [Phycisphaerae bacterium]|nr:hypothetical protein [Phycisphaerae bacterium]
MDNNGKDKKIVAAEQWVMDDVQAAQVERATISFWFGNTLAILGGAALVISIFGRGKIGRSHPLPETPAQT